jgi:hypothetical protein
MVLAMSPPLATHGNAHLVPASFQIPHSHDASLLGTRTFAN